MRASVRDAFRPFTATFEGVVCTMYCDTLGLVTTGIGNLIDPLNIGVLSLPWLRADLGRASEAEITAEWQKVKSNRWAYGQGVRALKLSNEAIEGLVFGRLDLNEAVARVRYPNWESFPADAQLAWHSMAWAAGSHFAATKLDLALKNGDFATCAGPFGDANTDPAARGEGWLRDSRPEHEIVWRAGGTVAHWTPWGPSLNPGLRPRNLANKLLFRNAAVVMSDGYDPARLYYPTELTG